MDRRLCAGLLLLAGMAGIAGCGQANSQTARPPTPITEVVYDTPITQTVTDFEDFPGRTDAIYTVEVRARVSGYLKRVYFHDGQEVRKDDLLFLIDPRPFQATLDRQKSTLDQAEAHAKRLNNEYRRAKALFEQGRSISREEFDRYAFDHAEAEAALGYREGQRRSGATGSGVDEGHCRPARGSHGPPQPPHGRSGQPRQGR